MRIFVVSYFEDGFNGSFIWNRRVFRSLFRARVTALLCYLNPYRHNVLLTTEKR